MTETKYLNNLDLGNGDSYEGNVQGKQKHGYGVYRYASGDVYEGDWLHDQQNGQGVYHFASGACYEGQFK